MNLFLHGNETEETDIDSTNLEYDIVLTKNKIQKIKSSKIVVRIQKQRISNKNQLTGRNKSKMQ